MNFNARTSEQNNGTHATADDRQENREFSSGRETPAVIAQYLPVTGAILKDLEQEQRSLVGRICSLEDQVEGEKQALKDRKEEDLDDLSQQLNDVKTRMREIEVQEGALRDMRLGAAAGTQDRAELARRARLEQIDEELHDKKAAYVGLLAIVDSISGGLAQTLRHQEEKAAIAYADAGFRFGVDDPCRVADLKPEMVASENGSVLDSADAQPIPQQMAWVVTVISGIAAGVSLGLAAKFLHTDTIRREVGLAVLCSVFGLGTSIALKYGVESVWREVSLRLNRDKKWYASAIVATCLTLLLLMIYSTVERRGLMSGMMVEMITAAVRGKKSIDSAQIQIAATFGSLFLTVPYLLLVSAVGFRKGTYIVNYNRAKAELLRQQIATEALLRSSGVVKEAFKQTALVSVFEKQIERLEVQSKANIELLKDEISSLEARKAELMDDISGAPTAQQVQLDEEKERLAAVRQRLEAEAKNIEAQMERLAAGEEAVTPAECSMKAVKEEARLTAARIVWEEQNARKQIELASGNLWQRLQVAVGMKQPTARTLRYEVKAR